MEDIDDLIDDIPEEEEILLIKLKNYLLSYYEPVQHPKDAEFHYSTGEIHQQLLRLYHNELILTPDLVANWLNEGGFTFYDYGEMKLEWMLKKA